MSNDSIRQAIGAKPVVERRIVNRPTEPGEIARQIRHHVEELNRLFVDAMEQDLQVELGVITSHDIQEFNPKAATQILISKLRIEKDY